MVMIWVPITPCINQESVLSRVYTKYSSHQLFHTPSAARTMYWIIPRWTVYCSQPVPHLSADHGVLNFPNYHNYKLTNELSCRIHHASLPNYWLHIQSLPLQLQSRSIVESLSVSKLPGSQCTSVSQTLHNHGNEAHLPAPLMMASLCSHMFTWGWPPSPSIKFIYHSFKVCNQVILPGVQRYCGNGGWPHDKVYIFGRPRSLLTLAHFHLILSYNENSHSIIQKLWLDSLCRTLHGMTQFCRFFIQCRIISSHPIDTLGSPE